jgi:hypothetical protein
MLKISLKTHPLKMPLCPQILTQILIKGFSKAPGRLKRIKRGLRASFPQTRINKEKLKIEFKRFKGGLNTSKTIVKAPLIKTAKNVQKRQKSQPPKLRICHKDTKTQRKEFIKNPSCLRVFVAKN